MMTVQPNQTVLKLAGPEPAQTPAPRLDDGRYDSMLACLTVVARAQGLLLSREQLIQDNQYAEDRIAPIELVFCAERVGMRSKVVRLPIESLTKLGKSLPVVVMMKTGVSLVLTKVYFDDNGIGGVQLEDPNADIGTPIPMDIGRFEEGWTGEMVLMKRRFSLADEDQPFSMWFIAALIWREKAILRDLSITAIFIGIFALAPIVYYRVLMSEVLYYYAMTTFTMVTIIILVVFLFETAFTYFREYLMRIIATRIDARVNEYTYDRLLKLPIDFFERMQVGEITHDIQETERIRTFLVEGVFGTVLDAALLLIFVPVMMYFSVTLTLIVFGFCSIIVLWLLVMLPTLRYSVGRYVRARVERGSFLYQTLAGIRTVKSLALESRQRARWDYLTAEVSRRDFDVGRVVAIVRTGVVPFERAAVAGAFAFGVFMAVSQNNTAMVGFLYSFLILSMRVAAPLMKMAQLVQQGDEARLAVARVASIVNRLPEENAGEHGIRRPLEGHVEFINLRFKYSGSVSYALDGVSFDVPVGTTLGLVGRSGSGKTTVTRLLQRLHSEYDGLIKIDGIDLRDFDLQHMRRSLGVVLQENFLFSGTIRENIIAAKPHATFDEVVNASRLAGAEEFIDRLPRGYDTHIFEGSPNLSGGQRQRLAIARALIVDPRILILDEATSALDPDSEAIVNDNIRRIAEGRTMLVISHRLSSLVNSDAILVLERGKVVDLGKHSDLLDRCDIYRNLWNQQNRHMTTAARHSLKGPARVS